MEHSGFRFERQLGREPIRVYLLLANKLDCEIIGRLFAKQAVFSLIGSSSDSDLAFKQCREEKPEVLIVDPSTNSDTLRRAKQLTMEDSVGHLVILDSHVRDGYLIEAIRCSDVSYLTRQTGPDALLNVVERVARDGESHFDPLLATRVYVTEQGPVLVSNPRSPSIGQLSDRELDVMRRLASGKSVRECAEDLGIAVSTADNHKSRLMKKLNIRKVSQLTRRAIQDGLVSV